MGAGGRVVLLTTPTETNSGRETRARVVFASLRLSSLCVLVYIYAREKHSEIPDNTSAFSLYSRHDTECGAYFLNGGFILVSDYVRMEVTLASVRRGFSVYSVQRG